MFRYCTVAVWRRDGASIITFLSTIAHFYKGAVTWCKEEFYCKSIVSFVVPSSYNLCDTVWVETRQTLEYVYVDVVSSLVSTIHEFYNLFKLPIISIDSHDNDSPNDFYWTQIWGAYCRRQKLHIFVPQKTSSDPCSAGMASSCIYALFRRLGSSKKRVDCSTMSLFTLYRSMSLNESHRWQRPSTGECPNHQFSATVLASRKYHKIFSEVIQVACQPIGYI